jgi:hypothetical protein
VAAGDGGVSQIGDLRGGLKDNLRAIPFGLQINMYAMANPTPPGIHLWPSAIPSYHRTFGAPLGISEYEFTVQAYVAFTTDIGAQELLDQFLGDEGELSVAVAIESDKTLGGNADDLMVQSSPGYDFADSPTGTPLLLAEWIVTVIV